jgi:hypothetical protein
MKKIIITLSILVILIAVFLFFVIRPNLTGKVIETYTYTRAICNKSNYCQDHEITCKGNDLTSIKPITGAFIQHPKDWKDPRQQKELC